MRNTLRSLRTCMILGRSTDLSAEEGMATAEYAIGTLAAAAFAGLLLALIRSGSLTGMLQSIIESALSV